MAFGARALNLTHRGSSASLATRVSIDIRWFQCARFIATVLSMAMNVSLSSGAALLDLERSLHGVVFETTTLVLDPVRLARVVG
eukprot:2085715-Pleurochrysis_carterae.AAC.1